MKMNAGINSFSMALGEGDRQRYREVFVRAFGKTDVRAALLQEREAFKQAKRAYADGVALSAMLCGVKISAVVMAEIEQALGPVAAPVVVKKPEQGAPKWPKELRQRFNAFRRAMEELPCNAVANPFTRKIVSRA